MLVRIEKPTDDAQIGLDDHGAAHRYLQDIDKAVEKLKSSLWPLNKYIHENPELAFQEHKAHDALTEYMCSHRAWKVTRSAHGIATAWIAEYDSGLAGPVVSFNAEMGHACGHNLIASASLAAGLATASMMQHHGLAGKVRILGTPGEEGIRGGKIRLLEAGAYQDVDISLISHPGIDHNSPRVRTTAFARIAVEYHGRAAHAANAPWEGVNALDALVIAYNAISVLRQQTRPQDIIGLAILHGGDRANVIHAYASGECVVRCTSTARLDTLIEKVSSCFHAGATATGARLALTLTRGYKDHIPNLVLADVYEAYFNALPGAPHPPIPPNKQLTFVKASTDQGNISYAMPSVNASFAIPRGVEGGAPHSRDFERASGMEEAFERALRVGKALAGVAVDVLQRPGLLDEVKEAWSRDVKKATEGLGD
ncbi:hypothetical protein ACEQ8H_006126 [Pleosporales sp. CAS-2024a]